jgi:hypothetical protein
MNSFTFYLFKQTSRYEIDVTTAKVINWNTLDDIQAQLPQGERDIQFEYDNQEYDSNDIALYGELVNEVSLKNNNNCHVCYNAYTHTLGWGTPTLTMARTIEELNNFNHENWLNT